MKRPDLRSVPVAIECRGDGKAVYACIGDPSEALTGQRGVIAFGDNLPDALHELATELYKEVGEPDHWVATANGRVEPPAPLPASPRLTVVVNGQPVDVPVGSVPAVIAAAIQQSGQIGAPIRQWELRTREGDVIPHDLPDDWHLTADRLLFLNLGLPPLRAEAQPTPPPSLIIELRDAFLEGFAAGAHMAGTLSGEECWRQSQARSAALPAPAEEEPRT